MGIDYTAFLKARVQADPNEAKKPDQQEDDIFGLNNEEIKKEEERGALFKTGKYLGGGLGDRSLATDLYETGQGVARGTAKAARDIINLPSYALQYSPYALTPAQGVISVGGGLLAGLAGDKDLDEQLSFSTMMDYNRRASRSIAEKNKLEEIRENINEGFAPLIDKLEQDYKSPLSRPAEIFGEFFSPVPMLQPVLWTSRVAKINKLQNVVKETRKTLLKEIKKQAKTQTGQGAEEFRAAVKGKRVDILEDPIKRMNFIKDNVPKNTLSLDAQRELDYLKKNEKRIRLLNFKNKNIAPALQSEAAASAMGAFAMSMIEQSTTEETGAWLAPLAGISVAVVGPPLVIGHGRSAAFNILGAYYTARARGARATNNEATALQFDDKALDSFVRSRGVNPNRIEDTQGNIITDPKELRLRKRQLLNATPSNMKYYAMLAKQLDGLDPTVKKQVYEQMQEYTRLYEKFRKIAFDNGNEEFADSFVPLVHNVIQLQSIRALQTTLLKNVHAGFFLSPKNFFKNKLTSDLENLTNIQKEQVQFLQIQLQGMKRLEGSDNEVDIVLKQLREMVKDVDATLVGAEQTVSTAGVGILGKLKSKVQSKNAAEDSDIILKGDNAVKSFLEKAEVGVRLNSNNKDFMLKNYGTSGEYWEIDTASKIKEEYDVQNVDLINKALDNASTKVAQSAEKNLGNRTIRVEDRRLQRIREMIQDKIANKTVMLPGQKPSANSLSLFDKELKQGYLENVLSDFDSEPAQDLIDTLKGAVKAAKNAYVQNARNKGQAITPNSLQQIIEDFSKEIGLGGVIAVRNDKGQTVFRTAFEDDLIKAKTNEKARKRVVSDIIENFINNPHPKLSGTAQDFLQLLEQNHGKGEISLKVLNKIRTNYLRKAITHTDPQQRFDAGDVVALMDEIFDDLADQSPDIAQGIKQFRDDYKNNLLPLRRQVLHEQKEVQRRMDTEVGNEDLGLNPTPEQKAEHKLNVAKLGTGGDNLFLSMIDPDLMEAEAGVISTLTALKNNTAPEDFNKLKNSFKRALGLAIEKADKGEGSFLNKLDVRFLNHAKNLGYLDKKEYDELMPILKVFDHMNAEVSLTQDKAFQTLQSNLKQLVDSRGRSGGSTYLNTIIKTAQDTGLNPIEKNVAIAKAIIATGDKKQIGLRYQTKVLGQTAEENKMISELERYLDPEDVDRYSDFIKGEDFDRTPIQKLFDELEDDITNGTEEAQKNAKQVKNALNDIFVSAIYNRGFKKTNETVNFRNITHKVAGRQHSSGFLDTLDPVELERAVNEYDPFFKALYKDDQKTYDQLQDLLKISRKVSQRIGQDETIGGMPSPFKVESVISRVYGIARGVVSARYVFSEWGIRQMRQGQAEVLRSFLTDPEAVNVAHEIFVQGKTSSIYAKNFYQKLFGTPTMAILINQGISQDDGLLVKYLDGPEQQVPQNAVDAQLQDLFS